MNFISYSFAVLFLIALTLRFTVGYRGSARSRAFPIGLLLLSLLFYGWHRPTYLLILFAACGMDFIVAQVIASSSNERTRKILLAASMTLNLTILFGFKYLDFFMATVDGVLHAFAPATPRFIPWGVVLPIGISFYTFESMSYTIDVYRGRIPPVKSVWKFLLFISFFPHLVAGPIVRARDFIHQIDRKRSVNLRVFLEGGFLMIRGFFLKMVVADNLGGIVDKAWPEIALPGASGSKALTVAILFSIQILADFEGYSTIARGIAYIMGYQLPINFNYPYIAGSFKNFWERWHITLSQWLRDYLYIPLGGNRGSERNTYRNLFLVMLFGGLWHGASFTYVIWGAIHGGALAIERYFGLSAIAENPSRLRRVAWFIVVQTSVVVAWIFFRSPKYSVARSIVENLISGSYLNSVEPAFVGKALLIISPVFFGHAIRLLREKGYLSPPTWIERSVVASAMLLATLTFYGKNAKFIYFQF
jgi:alginate O-acetyltransferase complex protein AlgI